MVLNLLFVTADAGRNLPPIMAVAGELTKRGHRTTVAGTAVHDPRFVHVPLAAPPVVALFHSFGALWGGSMARGPASTMLRPFGLSPSAVWRAADERLLLTDRDLDPLSDEEDTVGFTWHRSARRPHA